MIYLPRPVRIVIGVLSALLWLGCIGLAVSVLVLLYMAVLAPTGDDAWRYAGVAVLNAVVAVILGTFGSLAFILATEEAL